MRTFIENGETLTFIEDITDIVPEINQILKNHNKPELSEAEILSIKNAFDERIGMYSTERMNFEHRGVDKWDVMNVIEKLSTYSIKDKSFFDKVHFLNEHFSPSDTNLVLVDKGDDEWHQQPERTVSVLSYEGRIYAEANPNR